MINDHNKTKSGHASFFLCSIKDYKEKYRMQRRNSFHFADHFPSPPMKYFHCLNRKKYKQKLYSVSLLVGTNKNVSNAPQISLRRFIVLRKFPTSQLNESVLPKNHVSKLVIFPSFSPSLLSKICLLLLMGDWSKTSYIIPFI